MDKNLLVAKTMLCLPLDGLNTLDKVEARVKELSEFVGVFKIGKELFTRFGPEVIRLVHKYDVKVFLDLKYHDIPATVKGAAKAATGHGVWMFNVHASGGFDMMSAAIDGASEAISENSQLKMPKIIAVTILTSLSKKDLNDEVGFPGNIKENVFRLADLTQNSGLDGIVCSAEDLNDNFTSNFNEDFKYVTPGIQLSGGNVGSDQKRIVTPYEAIKNGSSLLVAGRTITGYPTVDERQNAAKAVLEDIAKALLEK